MPATQYGAKTDESDFAFQVEDMSAEATGPHFKVERGRVLDDPVRHRTVGTGAAAKTMRLCAHNRLLDHPCGACEFEAPKLLEAGR